jgi:sugar/nucleoside kinase (ribokinase family)
MLDICCVGHITLDKVVTPQTTAYMAGGTSYYFSKALHKLQVNYGLVTAVGQTEMPVVKALRAEGITVEAATSAYSVYFENTYSNDQDHRTQRVLQQADPFTIEQLQNIEAKVFHLGPLLANDMPAELLIYLAGKGRLSLDVQGYLRQVNNFEVQPADWPAKKEVLPYIHYLKVNEHELEVLTGCTDLHEGARMLAQWGVKEVLITLGSKGSIIYANERFYNISAYIPAQITDTTGCGDTYMAGYLYQRVKGAGIEQAANFAAAMAGLKIETSGPFTGTEDEVSAFLAQSR